MNTNKINEIILIFIFLNILKFTIKIKPNSHNNTTKDSIFAKKFVKNIGNFVMKYILAFC